jgi:drug/metabolite transporter (DMT)-like permease
MMKYVHVLLAVVAVVFGVMTIVYGGADDSPGAQLIGVVFVVGGVVLGVRAVRRSTR